MKKKEISLVVPTIYLLVLFVITIAVYLTSKYYNYYDEIGLDNITYVSNSIFNRSVPIVNIPDTINSPVSSDINIARYFYNYEDDIEKKAKSIVYYEGTYMPNTGIDYVNDVSFDVLAIFDGTVVDVSDDELLGKTVKIRHNGELISVYQGLDNIEVQNGDTIFTGQKIATSGESKINKDLGNHLHFEIYKNGITINPLLCINKKLGDI